VPKILLNVSTRTHGRHKPCAGALFKQCSKCHQALALEKFHVNRRSKDGKTRVCKKCAKARYQEKRNELLAYQKAYNAKSRQRQKWKLENPEKVKAHNAVHRAIKSGRLIKKPCVVCGDTNSQGHHEDYSKSLDVVWLCDKHHKAAHESDNQTRHR
jgi:hypothetical protein